MQFARLNGVTLHYQTIGIAEGRPLLVFANSLGTDFRIWRDVIVRVAADFAILTYDMRGHGLSDIGKTPYRMEDHAADLAALLDHIDAPPAIVCGISVGGLVAQALYAARPGLVRGLILCDTLDRIGTTESWNARIEAIRNGGIAAIADGVLEGWFTQTFREENPSFAGFRNMLLRQPVEGYVATCAALRDADFTTSTGMVGVPTLCIAGAHDRTAPPGAMAEFARRIPGGRFEVIREAGHIPCVEQPDIFAEVVAAFVALLPSMETAAHVGH